MGQRSNLACDPLGIVAFYSFTCGGFDLPFARAQLLHEIGRFLLSRFFLADPLSLDLDVPEVPQRMKEALELLARSRAIDRCFEGLQKLDTGDEPASGDAKVVHHFATKLFAG